MLNHRVSIKSMGFLALASALIALVIGSIGDYIAAMTADVGHIRAFWTMMIAIRIVIIIWVAFVPFYRHLNQYGGLMLVPASVSFAATITPWLLFGALGMNRLIFVATAHGGALIIWYLFLWESEPQKADT